MPQKKDKKKRAVSASTTSSNGSGKVKAFKRPGLLVSPKKTNKAAELAAGALAGFAAGALAGTVFGKKKKEIVVAESQDADSVRFEINTAKSKVFRECKEAEEKRVATLNEKNEKNTITIKEKNIKITDLEAQNSKMKAQIDNFDRRYKLLEEKQQATEAELQNSKRYVEYLLRNNATR